jgi:cell division protein FtsI/penicillin-binding protein 2
MKNLWIAVNAILVLACVTFGVYQKFQSEWTKPDDKHVITKDQVADALASRAAFQEFPAEMDFTIDEVKTPAIVQYSWDPHLQEEMEGLMKLYRPDYAAFVAIEPSTGRVLSLVSYQHRDRPTQGHLALRASFPSASVFKVVTAAAAIAEKRFTADTVISFQGRNHTLYKSHVFHNTINRWTRHMTLREAFAHSVNTVFAKIGVASLGAEELKNYADRFGFNRKIGSDLPIEEGRAGIAEDDWALAEAASGYTTDNTMSPMQGALIASSVINGGVMMEPYFVESIHRPSGGVLYYARPTVAVQTMDSKIAGELRELMKATVTEGTSRKSFRGFGKSRFSEVEVGGKTGSLTGWNPRGKYDWFVGYGTFEGRSIALCALTISEKQWKVKSSYLARRAIESYFLEDVPARTLASQRRKSR